MSSNDNIVTAAKGSDVGPQITMSGGEPRSSVLHVSSSPLPAATPSSSAVEDAASTPSASQQKGAGDGPSTTTAIKNKDRYPSSTRDLFTVYWFSCHFPNITMETAKGVTSTIVPIMVRQLMSNMAQSDKNKQSLSLSSVSSNFPQQSTEAPVAASSSTTSDTFLGLMLAAIGLGTAIFNVPVGVLIRRLNLSLLAAAGGAMYGFSTLVFVLVLGSSIWSNALQPRDDAGNPRVISHFSFRLFQFLLLVSALLWGMSFSCMSITRLLFVQHRVPKSYRSRLMSLIGGAQRWAMVIGPLVAGFVAQHFGLFTAFALHLPLCAMNTYSLYKSEVFRQISDEIKAEDMHQLSLSATSPASARNTDTIVNADRDCGDTGKGSGKQQSSATIEMAERSSPLRKQVGASDVGKNSSFASRMSSAERKRVTHSDFEDNEAQSRHGISAPSSARGLIGIDNREAISSSDLASMNQLPINNGNGNNSNILFGEVRGIPNNKSNGLVKDVNTVPSSPAGGTRTVVKTKSDAVGDLQRSFAMSRQVAQTQLQGLGGLGEAKREAGAAADEEVLRSSFVVTTVNPAAQVVAADVSNSRSGAPLRVSDSCNVSVSPQSSPHNQQDEQHLPGFKEAVALHWRILLIVGSYAFTMMFLRSSRTLLLAVNALNLNLPASAVGFVLSLSYSIDATLFFLGGYLSDKYGSERIAIVATSFLGISFLALGYPVAPSTIVITDTEPIPMAYYLSAPVMKLMLVGLLFGIANSLGSGLVLSLVANHAPKSKGNTILSLMRTVQDVGPLVGSLFTGVLLDSLGFNTTSVLFGVCGILNGLSAWVFMPKPELKKR